MFLLYYLSYNTICIGSKQQDTGVGKDSQILTSVAQELKSFSTAKETTKENEETHRVGKIFTSNTSDRELISRIYKKNSKNKAKQNKKTHDPINKKNG